MIPEGFDEAVIDFYQDAAAKLLKHARLMLVERSELLSKIEEQSRELVRLREEQQAAHDSRSPFSEGVSFRGRLGRPVRIPEPPRPFTSQEVYEGIPDLVAKADEMENRVDVPKVGE